MTGTNKSIGGGGFHHVAIRVKDFEKSVDFYHSVLGMPLRARWGEDVSRGALLDTGDGNFVEIFAGGSGEKPQGGWFHIALRCGNVDKVIEQLRSAGVAVTMEPRDVPLPVPPGQPAIRIAFFEGPDGESIELFQGEVA